MATPPNPTSGAYTTSSTTPTTLPPKAQNEAEYQAYIQAKLAAERKRHAIQQERSVRRKKERMELMRRQVDQLERIFHALCERAKEKSRPATSNQGRYTFKSMAGAKPLLTDASFLQSRPNQPHSNHENYDTSNNDQEHTNHTSNSNNLLLTISDVRECLGTSKAESLCMLANEVFRLKHENMTLRELLDQNKDFERIMHSLGNSRPAQAQRPIVPVRNFADDFHSRFFYNPFTLEECIALVHQDFQQNVANGPDFLDETLNAKLILGWRGFVQVETGSAVRFQLSKKRLMPMHVGLDYLINLYWKSIMHMPAHVYSFPVRMQVVQRVSDNIVVARRMASLRNGHQLHATVLLYQMQVSNLFLVGCVPLPPWGSGTSMFLDDPYGRPNVHQFHTSITPVDASKNQNSSAPNSHLRICTWGVWPCGNVEEAEYLAKELMSVALCMENLIMFESDRNLIE